MPHWKVCIQEPFLNCEKIYPIQQKKVSALLKEFEGNDNIIRVVIFGSSVTDRCHIDSDVDIYVELKEDEQKLIRNYLSFTYDLWTNYSADDTLKKEILKKGVIVYDNKKRNIA